MSRLIFLISLLVIVALSQTLISAQELVIEGNGAGSQNSVVLQSGGSTSNSQSNSVDLVNQIDASANTGGSSITTGDSQVQVKIDNLFNLNSSADSACCPTPSPTSDPGRPDPQLTPTPTSAPPNPTSTSSTSADSSSSSSPGGTGSAPAVLGLSATSTAPLAPSAAASFGLVCLTLAIGLLKASLNLS